MQQYRLGSSSAEGTWGPAEPHECESVGRACGDDSSLHAGWCIASRLREVLIPLWDMAELHLEYPVQCWASQQKTG